MGAEKGVAPRIPFFEARVLAKSEFAVAYCGRRVSLASDRFGEPTYPLQSIADPGLIFLTELEVNTAAHGLRIGVGDFDDIAELGDDLLFFSLGTVSCKNNFLKQLTGKVVIEFVIVKSATRSLASEVRSVSALMLLTISSALRAACTKVTERRAVRMVRRLSCILVV